MKYQPKFFSIVLIGRHNPQILNHDFLLKNEIAPPGRDLSNKDASGKQLEKAYSHFVSTPVLASIVYGNFSIVIEESRFQITDGLGNVKSDNSIIDFTKKYFSLLKHTPLTLGGLNFNALISFDSDKEIKSFEDKFISKRAIC